MMDKITLREYDSVIVKNKRDVTRNIISFEDATVLQSIVMDESPVFKWNNRRVTAQHWVGSIALNNLVIEILPKLYGYVDESQLRAVLTRMLLVSNQDPYLKEIPGAVSFQKDSLAEILIANYIREVKLYVLGGIQHSYQRVTRNIRCIKGKVVFNKQISKNTLTNIRFWCRYSMFTADNKINRFLKCCIINMYNVSHDNYNKKELKSLMFAFDNITNITREKARLYNIYFDSVNYKAEKSYRYGKLFMDNLSVTLNAGGQQASIMLFDMNTLYEKFIYKSVRMLYGNKVTYQSRGFYAIERESDNKRFIALRPDLILKRTPTDIDIIDTKWKMPIKSVKESDVYQMNAYSVAIPNVKRTILLYPYIGDSTIKGEYHFVDLYDFDRRLSVNSVNVLKCLDWKDFLQELDKAISPARSIELVEGDINLFDNKHEYEGLYEAAEKANTNDSLNYQSSLHLEHEKRLYGGTVYRPVSTSEIPNSHENEKTDREIKGGTVVGHKRFGRGIVTELNGYEITVCFRNHTRKFPYPVSFKDETLTVVIY